MKSESNKSECVKNSSEVQEAEKLLAEYKAIVENETTNTQPLITDSPNSTEIGDSIFSRKKLYDI